MCAPVIVFKLRARRHPRRAEGIREFLEKEFLPGKIDQAPYLTSALVNAGLLYGRHAARRDEWVSYRRRKGRLADIIFLADHVVVELSELDVFSHDDLAVQLGPRKIEELIGSLNFLSKKTKDMENEVQNAGKPCDRAEERWMTEVADRLVVRDRSELQLCHDRFLMRGRLRVRDRA